LIWFFNIIFYLNKKILAKANPPRKFNSIGELKRNFSKAKFNDNFQKTFQNKRSSEDTNEHQLCANCSIHLGENSKTTSNKKLTRYTPPTSSKVMIIRPPIKTNSSPYAAHRNFKVLKDIFSVKVVDNPASMYAVTIDGNFIYNQSS
jgi:hypothetical protein